MNKLGVTSLCLVGAFLVPRVASATKSAELYTSASYTYGRFEARLRFAAGDGVVSTFFLWKFGSEKAGTFWNELDYEKVGASCQLRTNPLYGNPAADHSRAETTSADLCGGFHVYAYEWTADYIAWFLDGTEIRRETGATAAAYAENASAGMQIHFNVWPGDASFGGNFNPSILPIHQYVDWVQFSSYAAGAFTLAWREDFDGTTLPSGWLTGDWVPEKKLATHDPLNVNFLNGCAVLSMTTDDATGSAGAMPDPSGGTGGMVGTAGTSGNGGTAAGASAGGAGTGGGADPGGSGTGDTGGMSASGAAGGIGGMTAVGGASGTAPTTGGAGGAGAASSAGGGSSGSVSSGGTAAAPAGNGGTTAVGGSPMGNAGTAGTDTMTGGSAGEGTKTDDAKGCGCRVPGSTRSSQRGPSIGAALVLALTGAFRRRRLARAGGLRS